MPEEGGEGEEDEEEEEEEEERYPFDIPWMQQRWSRSVALLILNFGARWVWVVNASPRLLYPLGRAPLLLYNRLAGPHSLSSLLLPPGYEARNPVESIAICFVRR
jgi:hypothetical protein